MKLVRIAHQRCIEYDRSSFVLAPDEWDEDEINRQILAAQDDYLKQYELAKLGNDFSAPKYPGFAPKWTNFPDLTVAQIQASHKKAMDEYNAWKKENERTKRSFESFLEDRGFVSIWNAEEDKGQILYTECDWGHRHSQKLEYGNDDGVNDMPTPVRLAKIDAGEQTDDDEDD
jgi:hypothetical protein